MEQSRIQDFESIDLRLASPEVILAWSQGEVTKPETINYRSQKPEKDGLFDERIFGPTKDFECYCGKYRRIRYKGIICDKCGVEVTRAVVRRERMGHIKLASPVSHIWFLRGVPSKIGLILNISVADLEKVVYFAGYIVTMVDEEKRNEALEAIEREFKTKSQKTEKDNLTKLKTAKENAKNELRSIRLHQVFSEVEYHRLSLKYGEVFEAGIGAEALRKILEKIDLAALQRTLEADLAVADAQTRLKIAKRLRLFRGMLRANIKPEWMFLTVIPVIPPDLRPMVPLDGGRYATADLNDLYRRVINRNNRLKRLFELRAPEVITRNEKRMLQEAVDALIDNTARRGQAPVASQSQRRPLKSLADMLKGKQGRFRQNLLGKRVDYSGRSVIVVGPDLKLDQCGLPKEMALELFKPFVVRKLIEREFAHNMRGASRLIEERPAEVWAILEEVIQDKYVLLNRAPTLHRLGIQAFRPVLIEGYAIQIHPLVCSAFNADFDGDQMAVHLPLTDEAQWEARELMASNTNLLKPATGAPIVRPTQDMVLGCFWVTMIEEDAKGEGKTFPDFETAILAHEFEDISLRARIRVRMPAFQQAGLLRATISASAEEKQASDKKSRKKADLLAQQQAGTEPESIPAPQYIETTVGRILLNQVLPEGYPFVNMEMHSKNLEEMVDGLLERYGAEETTRILDAVKRFGFTYATKSGISWGMDDLRIPPEKDELVKKAEADVATIYKQYQLGLLTDKERYNQTVKVWSEVTEKIRELVPKALERRGSIYTIISSKARGSWFQTTQMSGMKGLVINPAGRIIELPIISSYKEGLNVLEYFIATHGARKGTADTALKTAVAGYLTRRLVDVSQDMTINEEDCGAKTGIQIYRRDSEEIGRPFSSRIFSRVAFADIQNQDGTVLVKAGEYITKEIAEKIQGAAPETVSVRSPLSCRSLRGICRKCYGFDLGRNEPVALGEAVGIIAAQSIGEPGTQLTMRTFHTGGVAGAGDITTGLPRIDEIFEVRAPKGRLVISDVSGIVLSIEDANREKIVKIEVEPEPEDAKGKKKKKKAVVEESIKEFRIPAGVGLAVATGSHVAKGDFLSEGHADLKEFFKIAGKEAVERYIVKEVQKIYSLQGAPIHDKHIEVIARQMFSRVKIKDSGDTGFTPGEIVEKAKFREENRKAEREGGKAATAVQILLGITKVALTTDSFLSAASFMETARVLINAAVAGKEDRLRGLKENVIIGRLIPAGTGYKKR